MKALSQLILGEEGVIKDIENSDAKLKLMEMGCIPGVTVKLVHKSPMNGPIAIEIGGYILSLRVQEAQKIHIA